MPAVLLSAQPPHPPDDWGDAPGFDADLLKPISGAEALDCIGGLLGLEWQRAKVAPALASAEEAGLTVAPPGFPSAAEREELAKLASQGAIYEIEEWLARLRENRTDCMEFCRDVEHHLALFDFAGIVALTEGVAKKHV